MDLIKIYDKIIFSHRQICHRTSMWKYMHILIYNERWSERTFTTPTTLLIVGTECLGLTWHSLRTKNYNIVISSIFSIQLFGLEPICIHILITNIDSIHQSLSSVSIYSMRSENVRLRSRAILLLLMLFRTTWLYISVTIDGPICVVYGEYASVFPLTIFYVKPASATSISRTKFI